ncbi:MAG: Tm-1-like ATP-binding domain-containing protein [Treponemataceae bacterium]
MKTIAVIISIDTKEAEARFLKNYIQNSGNKALVIDISTRGAYDFISDISKEQVCRAGGGSPEILARQPKNEAVQTMIDGAKALLPALYAEGKIDAVISAGGLQNTFVAVGAMQTLPLGIPKVMVSTVLCGERRFEQFTGIKDIVMIPSIVDVSGMNAISETILSNAVAAVIGMVEHAGKALRNDGKNRIGATLMGVTNNSVVQAAAILEKEGLEIVCFHSTGVGGRYLENLINDGVITAAMDISLHEITSADVFNRGFSAGAPNRLRVGAEKGIPMLVAPGALDFIDLYVDDFFSGAIGDHRKRKFNLHNNKLAHIKLFPEEAKLAAEIVVERLNAAKGPVTCLLPLRGFRSDTLPGESLYDPEVDAVIIDILNKNLKREIKKVKIDANINSMEFSRVAAAEMLELLRHKEA